MAYNWNWQIFLQPSATGEGTYIDWLLQGLQWTLMLSLSSWVIALLVGSLVGVLRTVPNRWLSGLATCYVEVFRNIPLLVQLFIWYFVLPELLPVTWGNAFKQMNPLAQQFLAAMVCLGLFTAARVAEQVRAGINSLPRGQKAAGLALGLTLSQVYRRDAADGLSDHRAATDLRVSEYLQELRRCHHHRPDRTLPTGPATGRFYCPALRGFHRRHPPLRHHQCHRDVPDATL